MTISTLTTDDTNLHNGAMNDPDVPNPEVLERTPGRRQFSAKYKAKILADYDTLSRLERGALLRREGLYSSLITTWRSALMLAWATGIHMNCATQRRVSCSPKE